VINVHIVAEMVIAGWIIGGCVVCRKPDGTVLQIFVCLLDVVDPGMSGQKN